METISEWLTAGNCWTGECNHCNDVKCATPYDLDITPLVVKSTLNRKDYQRVYLYDEGGRKLGTFQWNLKGVFLTHRTGSLRIVCIGSRSFKKRPKYR